ncbi:hypothetical protein KCU63_g14142, partial [Aureobasidium melanogenum]
ASGRQVRPARTGIYGESLLSGQGETPDYAASETSRTSGGRATRNSTRLSPLNGDRKRKSRGYNSMDEDSEEDAPSSGNEWDGGDDDDDDNDEDDVDMADGEDEDDMDLDQDVKKSLVVKLKVKRPQESVKTEDAPAEEEPPLADVSRISVARQDLENLSTKDEPAPAPLVAEPPVEGHPAAVDSMDFEVPIQKTYHAHPPPAPLPAANIPDQQINGSV